MAIFPHPFFGQKKSLSTSKRRQKGILPPQVPQGCREEEIPVKPTPYFGSRTCPESQLLNSWNSVWRPHPHLGNPRGNLCLIFVGRQVAIGHHVFDRRRSKELQGKPPGITFLEGLGRWERPSTWNFSGDKSLGDFFVWMFFNGVYLEQFFIRCA